MAQNVAEQHLIILAGKHLRRDVPHLNELLIHKQDPVFRVNRQDTVGRAGEEIVRQQLSVPPTLTVRPGFPVRVIVQRDLVLEPYGG